MLPLAVEEAPGCTDFSLASKLLLLYLHAEVTIGVESLGFKLQSITTQFLSSQVPSNDIVEVSLQFYLALYTPSCHQVRMELAARRRDER